MTTLAAALDHICARLRDRALSVRVGAPTGETDLAIWPWRLAEVPSLRQTLPDHRAPRPSEPSRIALELHFLLVCREADDAVSKLILAHSALAEAPVAQVDGMSFQVLAESIATEELAALFTAAGVRLTLSSAYVMRSAG